MTASNTRIKKIADFVRTRQQKKYQMHPDRAEIDRQLFDFNYRWQHTLRVAQLGKSLAEAEGADVELVVAACLLHDVAAFDGLDTDRDHGRVGAEIARPFLIELEYTSAQIEAIHYAVAAHVDVDNPETLEAKIVTDADNLDRFWAYRILQWCLPDIGDYDKLAEKLRARIERLEWLKTNHSLLTPSGQKLFLERLSFQIGFYKEFVAQHDLSALPEL